MSKVRLFLPTLCLVVTITISSSAQTALTVLFNFNGTNGYLPVSLLIQGSDGNLYGTTEEGGTGAYCTLSVGCGTIFKVTPAGTLTTLYNFCSKRGCADGGFPHGGLVQGTDGNYYGTASRGGTSAGCGSGGCGTIFKITATGTLTTLYSFCSQSNCTDGAYPEASLVQASDGNFYGTTLNGGAHRDSANCTDPIAGCGTVFQVTPAGALTTLHSFCSIINGQGSCTDGFYPRASLIQGTNGSLYGTTTSGGTSTGAQQGTIFEITRTGQLTTLYNFCSQSNCSDGSYPYAGLMQASNGNFYGTTFAGGTGVGTFQNCSAAGCGTVFELTPGGQLTTLYYFCSAAKCADGDGPTSVLTEGKNGNLYGTTEYGGFGHGTAFEITPAGQLTTLHSWCQKNNCSDGGDRPKAAS